MRTILNFEIPAPDETVPAALQPPLFQGSLAASPGGTTTRWARCVTGAVVLHVALVAGLAMGGLRQGERPEPVSDPEVVFYAFRPPPPPPPAASTPAPTVARVQARRIPRPEPVIPRQIHRIEPKPVEPVEPEPEPTPVEEVAAAPAPQQPSEAPAGVAGGVAGGVTGGQIGGAVGGLVGAAMTGPLKLSQVLRAPKVLRAVKPDYPRSAKLAGVEGLVVVQVVIGADGDVEEEQTRIIRSVPGLDSAAIAAVTQYRFTPALGRDGRPARVLVNLPLQFNLH